MSDTQFEGSPETYVSAAAISKLFGVGRQAPVYWAKKCNCPCIYLPGGLRFRPSQIAKWLETRKPANP